MKKTLLVLSLFVAMLVQAGNHTIVVRGEAPINKDVNTVVSHGNSGNDTLTVHPAVDCSTIFVALKSPDGNVIEERQCAAVWNDQVTIIAPAALDAAGAFLSGVSGIVNGSFSWGSVVAGAALTSASAAYKVVSTATKIARWFKSLF